jgi:hypothetical protein
MKWKDIRLAVLGSKRSPAVIAATVLPAALLSTFTVAGSPADALGPLGLGDQRLCGIVDVPESETNVFVKRLEPFEALTVNPGGSIWAGVWGTGNNGPEGWPGWAAPAGYPLPGANSFSLIGRLDGEGWRYLGNQARVITNNSSSARNMYARVNDDWAGNGSGAFTLTYCWTVDTTPPETIIDHLQAAGGDATVNFAATGEAVAYDCMLQGPSGHTWRTCSSPAVYRGLADGVYRFFVRGRDRAGNIDPTPASTAWTVDRTAPQTSITSGPINGGWLLSTTAVISYTSTEAGSTFSCTLDNVPRTCSPSSVRLGTMSQASHVFSISATDSAGNRDQTPAVRTWTVPKDDAVLHHGPGWQLRSARSTYLGTYSRSTTRGATISTRVVNARKLALVASKGVNHGTVKVMLGSQVLRTVRLAAPSGQTKRVIPIATFANPRTDTVKIVVTSSGKQVRIEGLGVATR